MSRPMTGNEALRQAMKEAGNPEMYVEVPMDNGLWDHVPMPEFIQRKLAEKGFAVVPTIQKLVEDRVIIAVEAGRAVEGEITYDPVTGEGTYRFRYRL